MTTSRFTDIFIKRPVLATVLSLLILVFGLRAIQVLNLRQFPEIKNTVIVITTAYPGADAGLVQGFITTPLQKAIASADGIDYLTAESHQNISIISAHIKLDFDPNKAFTSVMSKAAEVRGELPRGSESPVIKKQTGEQIALMYISFNSDKMDPGQITDYISRVVQPKIETVPGVSNVEIFGASTFAMRVWLNPNKMAALNITPDNVATALRENNFQSAAGSTKGSLVAFNIDAETGLKTTKSFEQLIVKQEKGTLIRLKDIAKIELGAESYDSSVIFNGKKAVFVAVKAAPTANPLTVITHVRKLLPTLKHDYPPALQSKIVYDATKYIRSSIKEVLKTILEATVIVVLVIFLFLGSIRSVIIPVVTIPLSLIGVCSLILALGYSINLLTLLAMVLAIGLVVDDAIVVVENIHRHIEEGIKPYQAALQGAREIAFPVISMTLTLAAVYAPIGFMGGLTGSLFKEFAFTLASAVIISGVIALTLSPMMCSKLLTSISSENRFSQRLDERFERLKNAYQRKLHRTLDYRPVTLLFACVVLAACFLLYTQSPKQLAPDEDQSVLFVSATAPQYANIDYVTRFTHEFNQIYKTIPERDDYFIINGMGGVNNVISGLILKPWEKRKRSQAAIQSILQQKLSTVAGLNTVSFPLPSLPGSGGGLPIQFVVTSTGDHPSIYQAVERLKTSAMQSGLFMFIDSSLRFNKPELKIHINREKAAILGIQMEKIGDALATMLGENYVNRFDLSGRSYKVIPQVARKFRLNPERIKHIHIATADSTLIPLSTLVTLKETVQPNKLTQFQQLNAATLQGMMLPGKTTGQGLDFLTQKAQEILPQGMSFDYAGDSRRFMQEGAQLIYTFFFALIVIFLVLAAQFESFRAPLIILISVPMSILGALIPLFMGASTINIYSQIGLVTLIGLISKHGILMVEFANKLRESQGFSIREAIEQAASIRLRPILMTTTATILGITPLVIASGAGAYSRYSIGLVITFGMAIGTLFTLFVVPTMYSLLARR